MKGLRQKVSMHVERVARWIFVRARMFDPDFYCEEYPDVAAACVDPVDHYREHGWREGRRPSHAFDAAFVARSPIRRIFRNCDPVLVWYLLGRWLGWNVMPPEVRNFFKEANSSASFDMLLLVHEATRTGAPIFALRFVRWLREHRGVSPLVVLLDSGPLLSNFFRASACIPLFAVPYAERSKLMAKYLARHGMIYYNSLATLRAWGWMPREGRAVIVHCHEGLEAAAVWREQMAAAACAQPQVLSVSPETAPLLSLAFGRPPEIVPPAIDAAAGARAAAKARKTKSASKPVIIGCGVRSRRKGADLFCDIAARIISEHGSNIHFRWVGREGDVDMEQRLSQLGIATQVELVGEVADPLPHLARASALLLPSREDPFPLVALEAASCGVPVFCFDNLAAGVGTWVRTGAGAVVPACNIDLMAATLAEAINDSQRLATLAQGARLAAEAFDIKVIGNKLANIIWPT